MWEKNQLHTKLLGQMSGSIIGIVYILENVCCGRSLQSSFEMFDMSRRGRNSREWFYGPGDLKSIAPKEIIVVLVILHDACILEMTHPSLPLDKFLTPQLRELTVAAFVVNSATWIELRKLVFDGFGDGEYVCRVKVEMRIPFRMHIAQFSGDGGRHVNQGHEA